MSDLISETAQRLFSSHAEAAFDATPERVEDGASPWPESLWHDIEAMGMPLALLAEEDGGYGLDAREALGLVRIAGHHALPVPLGETLVANWLLAAVRLPLAEGPASLIRGLTATQCEDGWQVHGSAPRCAYGRYAHVVVALANTADGQTLLVRLAPTPQLDPSSNLAAEARDDLQIEQTVPTTCAATISLSADTWLALGATLRAQALAGALEATLALCVEYANERQQFGRPIGKFQAIQHHLALMAGEVAAARAGADFAAGRLPLALSEAAAFTFAAATAKLRTGGAAGQVAALAHQIHGAIGFSHEYHLHALTRRLWAWREEYGAEAYWAEYLGTAVCERGAAALWPFITAEPTGDAA